MKRRRRSTSAVGRVVDLVPFMWATAATSYVRTVEILIVRAARGASSRRACPARCSSSRPTKRGRRPARRCSTRRRRRSGLCPMNRRTCISGLAATAAAPFPSAGRRFGVSTAPTPWAFDLCAECRSSSLVVSGRFDQGHTSNHRVVEREQVRTWLHEFQAANPQLGVHEVLDIARMQPSRRAAAARRLVVRRRVLFPLRAGRPAADRLARPVFLLCNRPFFCVKLISAAWTASMGSRPVDVPHSRIALMTQPLIDAESSSMRRSAQITLAPAYLPTTVAAASLAPRGRSRPLLIDIVLGVVRLRVAGDEVGDPQDRRRRRDAPTLNGRRANDKRDTIAS